MLSLLYESYSSQVQVLHGNSQFQALKYHTKANLPKGHVAPSSPHRFIILVASEQRLNNSIKKKGNYNQLNVPFIVCVQTEKLFIFCIHFSDDAYTSVRIIGNYIRFLKVDYSQLKPH